VRSSKSFCSLNQTIDFPSGSRWRTFVALDLSNSDQVGPYSVVDRDRLSPATAAPSSLLPVPVPATNKQPSWPFPRMVTECDMRRKQPKGSRS
jgi:hypothetical protein